MTVNAIKTKKGNSFLHVWWNYHAWLVTTYHKPIWHFVFVKLCPSLELISTFDNTKKSVNFWIKSSKEQLSDSNHVKYSLSFIENPVPNRQNDRNLFSESVRRKVHM